MNGSSIMLRVNEGTSEAPDWTVIPCQTNLDLSISIGEIDKSCKDSAVNQYEPGAIDITASAEVMLDAWPAITGGDAHAKLVQWALAQQVFEAEITASGVPIWGLDAFITSVQLTAPREDSSTMSVDLRITGIPTAADESS